MRQWCNEVAASESVPFHDTINLSPAITDNVWFTVEFASEFHEGTFCKPGYIENGFIAVIVAARPGRGDMEAVTAIEKIIPALDAKVDPTQRLVLKNFEPIDEESAGTADRTYRLRCVFNYAHSL
jgi:hypothetical protein